MSSDEMMYQEHRAAERAKENTPTIVLAARIVRRRELAARDEEIARLREALSNLLRMFAGYSVDTKQVGFCTVADNDRHWIDEARAALGTKDEKE
jgi:hypothetical protein